MASRKRIFISLVLAVAAGVTAFFLVPKPLMELSRPELIDEVRLGYVHEVVMIDDEDVLTGFSIRRGPFRVNLQRGDTSLIQQLSAAGVTVKHENSPTGDI
ncbi:MAG TPA: hypothetical protein VN841_07785 [Bryobacteraceae bacterium]|nr:hypothetical protein [Bryobacteraceae bacterium]